MTQRTLLCVGCLYIDKCKREIPEPKTWRKGRLVYFNDYITLFVKHRKRCVKGQLYWTLDEKNDEYLILENKEKEWRINVKEDFINDRYSKSTRRMGLRLSHRAS